jgi:hypothetical protein
LFKLMGGINSPLLIVFDDESEVIVQWIPD